MGFDTVVTNITYFFVKFFFFFLGIHSAVLLLLLPRLQGSPFNPHITDAFLDVYLIKSSYEICRVSHCNTVSTRPFSQSKGTPSKQQPEKCTPSKK